MSKPDLGKFLQNRNRSKFQANDNDFKSYASHVLSTFKNSDQSWDSNFALSLPFIDYRQKQKADFQGKYLVKMIYDQHGSKRVWVLTQSKELYSLMNLSIHKDKESNKYYYHSRDCMKIHYYYKPTSYFKKDCVRIEAMVFNCKFNNVVGPFLLKNLLVEKDGKEQLTILYD